MTFTPEQVEKMEFLTAVRGYDKEEVRRFLGALADEMRAAERTAESLERHVASAPEPSAGPAPDLEDAARLTAELGHHLSTAVRLVEGLDELSSGSASPADGTSGVSPVAAEIPRRPPTARRESLRAAPERTGGPPPEWEELLADPKTDRS